MTEYILTVIDDDVDIKINSLVKDMCKKNKINYEKQDYRILFSDEKIPLTHNDVKFTSGSKKYLSFYGKIYLNKTSRIFESLYLDSGLITIEPKRTELILVCGGVENSTVVETDERILHFYVAPNHLLELQDPLLWKSL